MLSIDTSSTDSLSLPTLTLNDEDHTDESTAKTYLCPPFPSEEASLAYLRSITPPRDLHCPITQELFIDPVVAIGDGQTYERSAIQTWFMAQMRNHHGSIRSPVTNAYMTLDGSSSGGNSASGSGGESSSSTSTSTTSITTIVENKAIVAMVQNARESLGKKLCNYCESVWRCTNTMNTATTGASNSSGITMDQVLGDGGFRIRGLVEAGGDLSLKECVGGHTAFMMLILAREMDLVNFFISYDVPIHDITNDKGENAIQLIQQVILEQQSQSTSYITKSESNQIDNLQEWKDLEQTLTEMESKQQKKKVAKSNARNAANAQIRERQRVLATNARNTANDGDEEVGLNGNVRHQLGSLEEGWGYFPSLAALQFQRAIPEPSASFADYEMREKKRLRVVLNCIGTVTLLFLMFC